jgi:hypothetical protein
MEISLAKQFASSTLGHVSREYPHGLAHVMDGPGEISPSGLHPIFFGSFDWHSCVHGWWQLHRLARLFPELSPEIYALAQGTFTARNVQGELDYLQSHPSFERPYGWAWLFALHRETAMQGLGWEPLLRPMTKLISHRFQEYLPRLTYPVRAGTHANTAFALILAYDWASKHDPVLKSAISDWASSRFGDDVAAPNLEPSGEDFLSPTLTEAFLMAKTMTPKNFEQWFKRFLPELPKNLMAPVRVSDRSDGRIGHLDGLNLSRAWCWRGLKTGVFEIEEAANRHMEAAMPYLQANYMSEHWLCSFALLAMTESVS